MDVRHNTSGGDGSFAQDLVELFIVLHRQTDVARRDASFLVVFGGVTRELQKLGSEVLEDGGHVNGRTSTDLPGETTFLKKATNATYRKGEASLGRPGLRTGFLHHLLGSFGGHCWLELGVLNCA